MEEEVKTPEIDQETQPIAFTQETRAERLRNAASAPDFSIPEVRPAEDFFSESVMQLDEQQLKDMMRETGVTASVGEQTAVAIGNSLRGMNQLGDELKISYGNLMNYFTGNSIGDDISKIAYEAIAQNHAEIANREDAIGGITNFWAQLAGGATSFTQLALEGIVTAGALPLAHIGIQEFGQGTYNDMKAYADEHDGSLKGYEPKGFDIAANTANALLQVGIEAWLGVGSPRFLVGASRGLWVEGLSGALQEGVQGALSDLTEAVKGNQDISILLDNAEDYLRDAIVGGILQGSLGAVTHHQNYARSVDFTSKALAKARGHEQPTAEDRQQAKAIIDAKERQESSVLTKEFKAAFDASTGEGQLQAKIASALKKAAETKELDLDTANETEMAQRIEQIATQETMNAMDFAREQNRAISDIELNDIVYKDGAIWLEGLTPQVGDRAVSYARVLAERQSGLAEVNMKLDTINQEIATLKKDLAEAKQQKQESRAEVLQARIDKQNALAEKNRVRAERLKAQTAKLEKQIAKQQMEAPKAETIEMATVKKKEPVAERKSLKEVRKAKKTPSVDDEGLLHQAKPVKEIPTQMQQSFDIAEENARLDDIYPVHEGDTIEVDGKERSVYNSNGDRIAKSAEALTNFWRWFGDSKVVDEQGRPLVVYHGTKAQFNEFLGEKIGQSGTSEGVGFYFTNDKGIATGYGDVMSVYLKLEKPVYAYAQVFMAEDYDGDLDIMEANAEMIRDASMQVLEDLKAKGYEFYDETTSQMADIYTETDYDSLVNTIEMYIKDGIKAEEYDENKLYNDIREAIIKEFGFDGFKTKGYGNSNATVYVALMSNQIKSVDNRGTYSSDTGNILKQGSISGKGDTNRGGYDDALKRIILGEKSDLSTIQHEFAHYWIQNNFKWARSGLASQDWLRRWRDVEEWLGIEPQDRLLSRSASEKFAKAYERYILEGKVAPELQWAFEGFQKAYQDIYDDLENEYFDLDEELAPEVVDWFNRNKEQSPKRLLQADEKKLEKALTLAAGGSVIEEAPENTIVMTEQNKEGDPVVYMGVKESEIPAGDNLLVQADKTTASKLQRSAKNILSDKVEVQQLATLDTQATLQNFKDWIARDRAGAWNAMMNPDTRPIYRTYLYKAFAEEALNDVDLAIELANVNMAESVRELGQAIQALDIRNISGFDTIEIIRNIEKSKGTISSEELNKEVESIGLNMVELSQDEIDEVDFNTECKL